MSLEMALGLCICRVKMGRGINVYRSICEVHNLTPNSPTKHGQWLIFQNKHACIYYLSWHGSGSITVPPSLTQRICLAYHAPQGFNSTLHDVQGFWSSQIACPLQSQVGLVWATVGTVGIAWAWASPVNPTVG